MKLSFHNLFLVFATITGFAVAVVDRSKEHQPLCSADVNPCLETIHEFELCKTLHKWCSVIQDCPKSFPNLVKRHGKEYPWRRMNQTCATANTSFCPLSFSCSHSCTLDSQVSIKTTKTPWGENCTDGEAYCPLTATCMPKARKCSFRALYNWKITGNHSVTPSGKPCPAGQIFCPAKWSCVQNSTLCKSAAVNKNDTKFLCPEGERFSLTRLKCVDDNVTRPFPSFNHIGKSDEGSGYLPACRLHKIICARRLYAFQRCLPRVRNCLNRSESGPKAACARGSYRCNLCGGGCIPNSDTCGKNCRPDYYHCPTEHRCKPKGDPCPPVPVTKVPRVNCSSSQRSCAMVRSKANFCKRMSKQCNSLKDSPSNFTKSIHFFEHYTPWGEGCGEHSVFCPIVMSCLPKNQTCSRETTIPNEILPNKSPWGEVCHSDKKFCSLVMACIPKSFRCSLKHIADYALCEKQNKSESGHAILCNHTVPFNIKCDSNMTFCPISMSCIHKEEGCKFPFNRSISCDGEESFCQKTGRCIPRGHPCGTRIKYDYTNRLNGTQRVWAAACDIGDVICPRIHYAEEKCKANVTNDTTRACSRGHCPKGRCKAHAMQISQCFALNKYCPDLANKASGLQDYLKRKAEFPSGSMCNRGNRYCPLIHDCIPLNSTCDINSVNHNKAPITPWGEACRFGEYYCPVFGKCVTINIKCGWAHLIDWMKGHRKKSPYGDKVCTGNDTYCIFSRKCHDPSKPCSPALEHAPWFQPCPYGQQFCPDSMSCVEGTTPCRHRNHTSLNETFGFGCGVNRTFCPNSFSCVKRSMECTDFPSNDTSGWETMCQYRAIGCQNILATIKRCRQDCPWEFEDGCPDGKKMCVSRRECIPKAPVCCHTGSKFCNTTTTCISNKELCCPSNETFCRKSHSCIGARHPCLGPKECIAGKYFCREQKKCIPLAQRCAPPHPPPSRIQCKMVPPYMELSKVANGKIFSLGSTIALTSIDKFGRPGQLQYFTSSWITINDTGLSTSTALVVGKANKLRFIYDDSNDHGLVLVNYSVIAGSVGAIVDASSAAHSLDNILCLLKVPEVPIPTINFTDFEYEINEDNTNDKGFWVGDLMKLKRRNVSHDNHLPSTMYPIIPRSAMSYYFFKLNKVRNTKVGMAIVRFSGAPARPKEGVWQKEKKDGTWLPVAKSQFPRNPEPFLVQHQDKLRFMPAPDWNGDISFTVVGYKAVEAGNNDLGLAYHNLPKSVKNALDEILEKQNVKSTVRGKLQKAGEELTKKNEVPTEQKLLGVLQEMSRSARSAEDKADIATARERIVASFKQASEMEGKPPVSADLKYRAIAKQEDGGKYIINFAGKTHTFYGKVLPVNDKPTVTSVRALFPPIAYNTSTSPNQGFLVSEVTSKPAVPFDTKSPRFAKPEPLAKDVEGNNLGIGVVMARNSSLGSWYYRADGSETWLPLEVKNNLSNGRPSGNTSVFILPPNTTVKFKMNNRRRLWSNLEGLQEANLLFVAWDGSDGNDLGIHCYSFPNNTNSLSKKIVKGFMTRLGCDGRPGSKGVVDACGRCGGDGKSCRGCDGVLSSGARLDHCGNCTGGNTGLAFNFRKDCGGGCGSSFNDSCGVCQTRGRRRNFTDCSGTCFGKAKINRCGYCVGGSTGKTLKFGEDACGVCGGNGTTCQGCDGVANSGKVIDDCKKCLLPTDANFNSECMKLTRMKPVSGPKAGGTKIVVEGAGFRTKTVAKCKFEPSGGGAGVRMADVNIQTNKKTKRRYFELTSPEIASAGAQVLNCTFDSDRTEHELTGMTFFAYNKTAFSFTSIIPDNSETKKAPFNATVTGAGFVNSGYIKCVADGFEVDGYFISSTEVKCNFPSARRSKILHLAVAFGEKDKEFVKRNTVRFQFWVKAPVPVSATLTDDLQALIVKMNSDCKPLDKRTESCSRFFDAGSVAKFGNRPKCHLRTPWVLKVVLRTGSTIKPFDTISFINGSLIRRSEEVTKNSTGYHTLTVRGPLKAITPKAHLIGPPFIGSCGPLKLDASKSRGAGRGRLILRWTVKWADSQDTSGLTAAQTKDLSDIEKQLAALSEYASTVKIDHPKIKIGLKYEFGVTVTDLLNTTSANSTLIVERQNKKLPSLIIVGYTKGQKFKAARVTTLDARVRLSPCLDRKAVAANVIYTWEIDAVAVDIGRTDKSRLRIKKGTLRNGKSYTLTVTVAMASNQDLTVSKSITFQVESSPLIAVIKAGSYEIVGHSDTFVLDGTRSRDPDDEDNAVETPWYKWECYDSDDFPCFEPDPGNPSRDKRMVLGSKGRISIDVAKRLKPNSRYRFVLTFNKGLRSATSETKVFVAAGAPPKVRLRPQKDTKENPTGYVAVRGRVITTFDVTNIRWSSVEEEGYGFVDLSAEGVVLSKLSAVLRKASGKTSASLGVALVLNKGVLMGGTKYKFRLKSNHSDSSAYAETEFVTNSPPSQGTLVVNPTNGTALQTMFTVSASEGWSDDADDLPLTYHFGYYKKVGARTVEEFLNRRGESSIIEDISLPQGDEDNSNKLKIFVDVSDNRGARTRAEVEITVNSKIISTDDLTRFTTDLGDSLDSGSIDKFTGDAVAIMDSLDEDDKSADPAEATSRTEFKKTVSKRILNFVKDGGLVDDDTKRQIISTIAKCTRGGNKFDVDTKRDISSTFRTLEAPSSSSRRRRRAVSTPTVEPYTPAQAEATLSLLSNLIIVSDYTADSMSLKSNYLAVAVSMGQKMCASLFIGQPAAIARNSLSVVSSVKDNFVTADSAFVDVACSDCPDNVKTPAKLLLGTALKDMYSSWGCTGDTTCSGTCLVTTQFPYDLLANSSNNASLTNTVQMKLYNPETYAELIGGTLASPYTLRLPMEYNPNVTSYTANQTRIECKRWDDSANHWTVDGCVQTETASLVTIGNITYVECRCTQLGYISAFATNEPIPSTPAPSTQPATEDVATTSPPVYIRIVFNIDYRATVTKFGKATVEASIKNKIVSTLGISESRISDLTISQGSIVVNFLLLPEPNATSNTEINARVAHLEEAVKSGNFSVTLPDGSTIKADPTSFKSSHVPIPESTTLAPKPTESSGLTQTEIIIISVVCSVVALVIIIVVVVYCCKRNAEEKNKVLPKNSSQNLNYEEDVELADRGGVNDGFDNSPNKGESSIRT